MKRFLILLTAAAVIAAIPASLVMGKGHVSVKKIQVCHQGFTVTVSKKALKGHLGHGDLQLPACDFNNVFQSGDDCTGAVDGDGDGRADFEDRDDASGQTDGCPEGSF